ncbi:hypothetical protein CDAR_290651 [Caerostris darwini]|uniref:Secreted protein n=1 Tax=Caerostris darwini TaxID=1538125 RepID=A0AAV4SXS4_9ARAC|nr:hypothetical protein CDAR_290651 [Caerostris darwini]
MLKALTIVRVGVSCEVVPLVRTGFRRPRGGGVAAVLFLGVVGGHSGIRHGWMGGGGRLQDCDVVRPLTLESLVALAGAAAAGLAPRVVQARGYRRLGCVEVLKGQGVRSRLTCSREKEKCTSRSRIE